MTRRTTIRHLLPDTNYVIRVTANNAAGSSSQTYRFLTRPHQLPMTDVPEVASFMTQPHVLVPVIAVSVAVVSLVVGLSLCARKCKWFAETIVIY